MTCNNQYCPVQHNTTQPSAVWPWRRSDQITLECNHSYHPECFSQAINIQWRTGQESQALIARCASCNQQILNIDHLVTPYLAPRIWNFALRKPMIFLGTGLGFIPSFLVTILVTSQLFRNKSAIAVPINLAGGLAGGVGGAILTDKLLTFAIVRIYHWANDTVPMQPLEHDDRLLMVHERRRFHWQKSNYRTNPV